MHENTYDYRLMGAPLYHLQTTSYIPLTLSSINVPREVNILYLNNVVKLVEYGRVLRSFRNVNYFFFFGLVSMEQERSEEVLQKMFTFMEAV